MGGRRSWGVGRAGGSHGRRRIPKRQSFLFFIRIPIGRHWKPVKRAAIMRDENVPSRGSLPQQACKVRCDRAHMSGRGSALRMPILGRSFFGCRSVLVHGSSPCCVTDSVSCCLPCAGERAPARMIAPARLELRAATTPPDLQDRGSSPTLPLPAKGGPGVFGHMHLAVNPRLNVLLAKPTQATVLD